MASLQIPNQHKPAKPIHRQSTERIVTSFKVCPHT
jgi:hypothetical protein